MPVEIEKDLNATITAAVNARVEAEMMKALSGDATIGAFVTAALAEKVDAKHDPYGRAPQITYLSKVLRDAIQAATKAAVEKLISEEIDNLEAEVRKALRRDLRRIAETLTQSLVSAAGKPYGVNVSVELKMPNQ